MRSSSGLQPPLSQRSRWVIRTNPRSDLSWLDCWSSTAWSVTPLCLTRWQLPSGSGPQYPMGNPMATDILMCNWLHENWSSAMPPSLTPRSFAIAVILVTGLGSRSRTARRMSGVMTVGRPPVRPTGPGGGEAFAGTDDEIFADEFGQGGEDVEHQSAPTSSPTPSICTTPVHDRRDRRKDENHPHQPRPASCHLARRNRSPRPAPPNHRCGPDTKIRSPDSEPRPPDRSHRRPLIDIAEAEQARLDTLIVVGRAESVVAKVRQDELLALQKAAYRRRRRPRAG